MSTASLLVCTDVANVGTGKPARGKLATGKLAIPMGSITPKVYGVGRASDLSLIHI